MVPLTFNSSASLNIKFFRLLYFLVVLNVAHKLSPNKKIETTLVQLIHLSFSFSFSLPSAFLNEKLTQIGCGF